MSTASKTIRAFLTAGRRARRPYTLIDFFKQPFLTDHRRVACFGPAGQGMYNGDRARKETLVEHGFRLPCALDNRPLQFNEFEELLDQVGLCLGNARRLRTGKERRRFCGAGHPAHPPR